ncbi:MAG: hypothetical protein HKN04_03115 [Rhodothermaceae bacterium]|nr:hypothetical protein [Rhodothermaceae bacterium]
MSKPWFDPETGMLMLDEYVSEMPSYRRILADEVVSEQEYRDHAEQTVNLLRRLEETLPDDAKALATEALCELAVLYALERHQAN